MKFHWQFSPAHKKIITALVCWYVTSLALAFFLVSKTLDDVTGRPAIYPGSFNTLPLLMPAILLGALCLYNRKALQKTDVQDPSWKQLSTALYVSIPVILLSFFITHPGEAQFAELQRFVQTAPVIGGTILSGVIRAALLLPALPLLFAFVPLSLIKKFTLQLTLILGVMFVFLFANTLDALFYDVTMPFILTFSYWPLQLVSGDVSLDAAERLIRVGDFKAYVGPTCAGFSLLAIFLGFYAVYWEHLSRLKGFSAMKAMIALPIGLLILFFLNILRISVLMLLGDYSPELAVVIFHGAAGTLILLGVAFVYLQFVRRWIVRKS
jgi:exosortase/archaeosortase family protein